MVVALGGVGLEAKPSTELIEVLFEVDPMRWTGDRRRTQARECGPSRVWEGVFDRCRSDVDAVRTSPP